MRAIPATVEARTETRTPYGGLTLAWTAVATVWVVLEPATPRSADGGGAGAAPLQRAQTATGDARVHPALVVGARLSTGDGPPWTITSAQADAPLPGRCRLTLDRLL